MIRALLCAGSTLLVIDKDGVLFYRRAGQPDVKVPYAPRHYPVFFHSARYKYDLCRVIGPDGQPDPPLPEGTTIPELRSERLATGETVFRIVAPTPSPMDERQTVQDSPRSVPATPGVP